MDKKTILIADDEKEIRDLVRLYLENEGFELVISRDGEEAYKEFEEMKALIDNKYYLNQSDFVRHAVRNEIHKKKLMEELKKEREDDVKMMEDSRNEAVDRLIQHSKELGANAVIAARFDSNDISEVMQEILAYGTAVVIEKE